MILIIKTFLNFKLIKDNTTLHKKLKKVIITIGLPLFMVTTIGRVNF